MTSISLSFCKGENNEEFTSAQTMFFRKIVDTLLDVMHSGEFKEAVEDYHYKDEDGNEIFHFNHSDGLSGKEIYHLLLYGSHKASSENVNLNFLIQPCTDKVEEHACFLDGTKCLKVGLDCLEDYLSMENKDEALAKTAALFIREYLHLLGFKSENGNSVPEAIGNAVEKLILENYMVEH